MNEFSVMLQSIVASLFLTNDLITPVVSIFRTFREHIAYIIVFAIVSIAAIVFVIVYYYKKKK